jgi:hypothetical protein
MIEPSAALTTIASAVAPPPAASEANLRAPTAEQPQGSSGRSTGVSSIRYFRFNLRYDAVDQQLYFVFKNPVTGAVVGEAPSERSVRSTVANRPSASGEFAATPRAGQPAPAEGAAPASSGSKLGAPGAQAAPAAPASGGEAGRGSAVDSRI